MKPETRIGPYLRRGGRGAVLCAPVTDAEGRVTVLEFPLAPAALARLAEEAAKASAQIIRDLSDNTLKKSRYRMEARCKYLKNQ